MKKLFFFAMVALGMTAACQKPDVKVENPDLDDNAPVAVQFNVNAPTLTVTKTKAAVEAWNDTQIYVYSGIVNVDANPVTTSFSTPLIDNKEATVASDGKVKFGTSGDVYYYDVDKVYNFYGYYIDNATFIPNTDGDEITNDGTTITADLKITGSQDIMLATTNKEEDLKDVTSTVNANRIYSAYTARRGVHPTLNFEHMLSRFIFNVKLGAGTSNVKKVYVSKIEVEAPTQGTLTIAPTQSFVATNTDQTITAPIKAGTNGWYEPLTTAGAACDDLFLFPNDATIPLTVSLMAEGETDENNAYEMPLDLTPDMFNNATSFDKGKKYTLTLTVYNLEQVMVDAKVATWTDGGEDSYDPDDKYDEATGIFATKVTNSASESVLLYSAKRIANNVEVFSDYKMETAAADDTYTTATHTITVTGGKVTAYEEITPVP